MIYFDNAATTEMSVRAIRKMTDIASACWGNPSSLHETGLRAEREVKTARSNVMSALGVKNAGGQLFFCGSGTEANNLAILGCARAKKRTGKIIISDGEHASIEEPVRLLEESGFEIVRVPVKMGVLDIDFLKDALDQSVVLVSMMAVNNETGAVYDLETAFAEVRKKCPDAVIHSDAAQGFLKVNVNPRKTGAHLVTISAHKIHGPKGVGALYVDASVIRAKKIVPLIYGGGQESGFRSGTENVAAIASFGEAAAEFSERGIVSENEKKMTEVRDHLISKLESSGAVRRNRENLGDNPRGCIMLNLPEMEHAPHIVNITLPNIKSEVMLHRLSADGICVSSGSACSSNSRKISRALTAFGLSPQSADCSVRVSFSEKNTFDEVDFFVERLTEAVSTLVKMR